MSQTRRSASPTDAAARPELSKTGGSALADPLDLVFDLLIQLLQLGNVLV